MNSEPTTPISSKGNGAMPEEPQLPSADMSIFDNLDALRIADPASLSGDIEHLSHIYIRRPKKDEYFRVHHDPAMTLTTLTWTDPDEGDVYFVTPSARDIMAESGRVVTLVLCQSRQSPRITVDWDTSQADDFRTRGGSWTIK